MTKKIGSSLSMCLRSIGRGEVALDDVAFIITSTAYPDRATMMTELRKAMLSRDVETHMANAAILWDTGRIFQPSVRPANRYPDRGPWADSPDFFLDVAQPRHVEA